jgi:hypothetical protein
MATSLSSGAVEYLQKEAKRFVDQLRSLPVELSGKRFLHVDSAYGFDAKLLRDAGATVYGVEHFEPAREDSIRTGKLDTDNVHAGTVHDMPRDFAKDVNIAAFTWYLKPQEYDHALKGLSSKISMAGMVILDLECSHLEDPGEISGVAVKPHAERYFGKVEVRKFPDLNNRQLLICTNPMRQ